MDAGYKLVGGFLVASVLVGVLVNAWAMTNNIKTTPKKAKSELVIWRD